MSDLLRKAMEAKSDQLNAVDILGVEPVIRVRDVVVRDSREQPVSIYFDGDNNRPWKPSKGMIRVLCAGWGDDETQWIGRHCRIICDPSVIYAGKEAGGVRVVAMSNINPRGFTVPLAISKAKRIPWTVSPLVVEVAVYPEARFVESLPAMTAQMASGKMTLQQVIAHCQKTGALTQEQLARLEQSAPALEGDADV